MWSPEFSAEHFINHEGDHPETNELVSRKLQKKKKNSKMNVLKKSKKDSSKLDK